MKRVRGWIAALLKSKLICAAVGASLCLLSALPAHAEDSEGSAVVRFLHMCGSKDNEALESLPGKTISKKNAPKYFGRDLARSGKNHRVTKVDGEYAMRAVMQGPAGLGATLVKCALGTDKMSYDDALAQLVAVAGEEPMIIEMENLPRRAAFTSREAPYQLFEERDGWISIYRMDILISAEGVDPKYLKEGAEPVPIPDAR